MISMVSLGQDSGNQGHLHARFIAGDRHRFSAALGPSLLIAQSFGTVAFANLEFGYEYRAKRGVSFIIATGPTMALSDSGQGSCASRPDQGWFGGCWVERESYRAGEKTRRASGPRFQGRAVNSRGDLRQGKPATTASRGRGR
jgi:hypothetical protein